ncbi:MAG: cupin-like domain-containing protein [Rhizobiaceae bacterium]
MQLEVVKDISQEEFVAEYVAKNKPVVVDNIPYSAESWTPEALKDSIGELTTQIYGTLFDLENIASLEEYLEDHFGQTGGAYPEDVPYVRWYNQLKDVDFVWGDEAFEALQPFWQKPACVPDHDLIVPVTSDTKSVDPVMDNFPYRGILIAARGARTRMHRDPFCSDAIVAQFYGTKQAVLYHPDRTQELMEASDGSSFGGFIDVREEGNLDVITAEPDYQGLISPGQMIYIPHGWLHDVLVVDDSVSVTWNFVHKQGAQEFLQYLKDDPSDDSEFEVLQHFIKRGGLGELNHQQLLAMVA